MRRIRRNGNTKVVNRPLWISMPLWCGPCKAIAPVLEKLAAEYKGKIVVYKIDTDKEP